MLSQLIRYDWWTCWISYDDHMRTFHTALCLELYLFVSSAAKSRLLTWWSVFSAGVYLHSLEVLRQSVWQVTFALTYDHFNVEFSKRLKIIILILRILMNFSNKVLETNEIPWKKKYAVVGNEKKTPLLLVRTNSWHHAPVLHEKQYLVITLRTPIASDLSNPTWTTCLNWRPSKCRRYRKKGEIW